MRIRTLLLWLIFPPLMSLTVISILICCHTPGSKNTTSQPRSSIIKHSKDNVAPFSLSDLKITGDSTMLCRQRLTSEEALMHAFNEDGDLFDYCTEQTKDEEAFYYPDQKLRALNESKTDAVQLAWNYAAVLNRVVHSLELFQRASSAIDDEFKFDTLAFIKEWSPKLSKQLLIKAIPNDTARNEAYALLASFKRFDGIEDDTSPFIKTLRHYIDYYSELPRVADDNMIDVFDKAFWDWYDKKQFVPEIDEIVKINLDGSDSPKPTEQDIEHFRRVVTGEENIDKRAILALEYAKFDRHDGALLLGDIIESRQYTRYLLECWISWRANAQSVHSISSMTVIPNNYFDKIRILCLDTMLRQALEHNDDNALCLIQNLITCECLHRQASLIGNESFVIRLNLNHHWFIHPRLKPKEQK